VVDENRQPSVSRTAIAASSPASRWSKREDPGLRPQSRGVAVAELGDVEGGDEDGR